MFPDVMLQTIVDAVERVLTPDGDILAVKRALNWTDPSRMVGVFISSWMPDQESIEICGRGEPVMGRYTVSLQNMVKSTDEVIGDSLFTQDWLTIKNLLYRDTTFQTTMRTLTDTQFGKIERVMRFGVLRTTFRSAKVATTFSFLGDTDLYIDTTT